jgi:GDP-4-dehydro-6-deoxy-D-mannose reductase
MKALITGINGFVGGHLERFLKSKNIEVYGLEHQPTKYITCDITDKKKLRKVIVDIKPDFIFHLAAISAVEICEKNPDLTYKVNVTGFKNILEIIDEEKIDCKILLASSSNVYGKTDKEILDEDEPVNPVSVYAKTKLECEKLTENFLDVDVVISRSFNHIGPGQQIGFITSDFASQIARIEKTDEKTGDIHVGNLETIRDYTDVRDIVNAYYLLITKGKIREPYNVCSKNGYSGKELLEILMKNTEAHINIIQKNVRKNDLKKLIGDNSKLVKDTGWKPIIEIEESLKDILDYWRDNV